MGCIPQKHLRLCFGIQKRLTKLKMRYFHWFGTKPTTTEVVQPKYYLFILQKKTV